MVGKRFWSSTKTNSALEDNRVNNGAMVWVIIVDSKIIAFFKVDDDFKINAENQYNFLDKAF